MQLACWEAKNFMLAWSYSASENPIATMLIFWMILTQFQRKCKVFSSFKQFLSGRWRTAKSKWHETDILSETLELNCSILLGQKLDCFGSYWRGAVGMELFKKIISLLPGSFLVYVLQRQPFNATPCLILVLRITPNFHCSVSEIVCHSMVSQCPQM